MTRTQKIWLGILTFLPVILFAGYFLAMFSFLFNMFNNTRFPSESMGMPETFLPSFFIMFGIAGLLGILSLGLLIYYIIHCVNNKTLDSNERVVWILVFMFMGLIGFPIYWYLRIWQAEA
jgi:hypothetical protein